MLASGLAGPAAGVEGDDVGFGGGGFGGRVEEVVAKGCWGEWGHEVSALGGVAAEAGERGDMLGGGDAEGGDVQAAAAAEFNGEPADGGGLVGDEHVADELCGDLEIGGGYL